MPCPPKSTKESDVMNWEEFFNRNIGWLVSGFLALCLAFLGNRFASKKELKELEEKVDNLDKDVSVLAEAVNHLPKAQDIKDLHGEVSAVKEISRAVQNTQKSQNRSIGMIQEALIREGKDK